MNVTLIYVVAAISCTGALLWLAMRPRSDPNPPSIDDVKRLAADGKRIEAIKAYRRLSGATLEEAKAYVERLQPVKPS